jgi:hypothetical protein
MWRLLFVFLFIFSIIICSFAQTKNSESKPISQCMAFSSAQITNPIQIDNDNNMSFGNISPGSESGKIQVYPNGNRIATGGASIVKTECENGAASFKITGAPNTAYCISLPGMTKLSSNNNEMMVSEFTSNQSAGATLNSNGESVIQIGASLDINPNQAPGYYSGNFDIIVAYN